MFCSKCGNELKKGEKICSKCGTDLSESGRVKKNQRTVITILLCILVIVGLISGIQHMVSDANKNSIEYGKYRAEELNNTINIYKDKIVNKWNVTLPYNSINGLECAVYYKEGAELYLKYNMGICMIDGEDKINRYVKGDDNYNKIDSLIKSAEKGSDNYMYMSLEEFKGIIE